MKKVNMKCPYCGANAHLKPASVVYGDRTKHPADKLYVCDRYPFCDAYVGAHRDTFKPMGTLANRTLRRQRIAAHDALDHLMRTTRMSRKELYRWLQVQLGLPEVDAHIAHFSELRYRQVIALCNAFGKRQAA